MAQPTDAILNPMGDYQAEAERRERAIPDRKCGHGGRLRSCGHPDCVEVRYNLLRKDAERGQR